MNVLFNLIDSIIHFLSPIDNKDITLKINDKIISVNIKKAKQYLHYKNISKNYTLNYKLTPKYTLSYYKYIHIFINNQKLQCANIIINNLIIPIYITTIKNIFIIPYSNFHYLHSFINTHHTTSITYIEERINKLLDDFDSYHIVDKISPFQSIQFVFITSSFFNSYIYPTNTYEYIYNIIPLLPI